MDDADKTQGKTQAQNQQQPQAGGVSTLIKERELPVAASADSSVSEFIKPSGPEAEPKIHDELEKIGVRTVSEFPKVGHEEEKVGIKPAGASVPVKTEPIPTDEEIQRILKTTSITDSQRWWAKVVEKVRKHIKLIQQNLLTRRN